MQPCEGTSALLPRRPNSHFLPQRPHHDPYQVHTVIVKLFCHDACLLMCQLIFFFANPEDYDTLLKASTLSTTLSLRLCNSRQVESIFKQILVSQIMKFVEKDAKS